MEVLKTGLERLGFLFYVIRNDTMNKYKTLDEVPDLTTLVIPIFVLLILLEASSAYFLYKKKVYRLNDLISSFISGMSHMAVGLFIKSWNLKLFNYVHERFSICCIDPNSPLSYILFLLGIDFAYYWFHRIAHTYHVLWSAHSVHHSGEDYNLATALRQGMLQNVTSFFFPSFLAFFLSPKAFAFHCQLNTLTQFWFHTSVIGKLGPLEYFVNTPSHHRMHHRPPGNCNYGGVLIIYDRIFGTFQEEDEQKDYYGLAANLNSFDTVWANIQHLKKIFTQIHTKQTLSPLQRILKLLSSKRAFHTPTFEPYKLVQPLQYKSTEKFTIPSKSTRTKYNGDRPFQSSAMVAFSLFFFFITTPLVILLYLFFDDASFSIGKKVVAFGVILSQLITMGKLLNNVGKRENVGLVGWNCLSFFVVVWEFSFVRWMVSLCSGKEGLWIVTSHREWLRVFLGCAYVGMMGFVLYLMEGRGGGKETAREERRPEKRGETGEERRGEERGEVREKVREEGKESEGVKEEIPMVNHRKVCASM